MPNSGSLIKELSDYLPEEGRIYLLDTNVWQFVIRPPTNLKTYEKVYVDFFDALINLSTNVKCKNKPYIYVNGLILSEVFNAYMRSTWDAHRLTTGKDLSYKDYRSTEDYKKHSRSLKSDFESYKPAITSENAILLDALDILTNLPDNTDYNDDYYYHLALKNNMIIVTNDGDFKYKNVEILTNNRKLIQA